MPTRDEILTNPLTAFGKTQLFFQWAVSPECRVPWRELLRRLILDWPAETALSTPDAVKRFPKTHKTKGTGTRSRFRGVSWHARTKKWQVRIHDRKSEQFIFVGYFSSDVEAALAFDAECRKLRGKRARCNFPEPQ